LSAPDDRVPYEIVASPGTLSDERVQRRVRASPDTAYLLGPTPDALVDNGLGDVLEQLVRHNPQLAARSARASIALQRFLADRDRRRTDD
jgi:hypothetical protein